MARQGLYNILLNDLTVPVVIAVGPAGTGKTFMATAVGAKLVEAKRFNRIVVSRPAVSVDENHGFLPGNLDDKMAPWVQPVSDSISKSRRKPPVEICPLAYMRGRTFDNAWIIADEMQNSTPSQMKMVMTRIGHGSKLVITGDMSQHDGGFNNNGLSDVIARVHKNPSSAIRIFEFTEDDVMRSAVIKEILKLYN